MPNLRMNNLLFLLTFTVLLSSCREVAVPRPKGYFRIDLPQHKYIAFNSDFRQVADLPLSFEYPAYGKIFFEPDVFNQPGWFNIEFPAYKARIYLTYIDIKNDIDTLIEQTYKLNIKNHITKADAINEQMMEYSTI
jgi:gliding motility-associated lipoprotein GldD